MVWIVVFAALLAGTANPFQSATNAELGKELGRPIWTMIAIYGAGLVALLIVQAFVREPLPSPGGVRWWAWSGGLISIVSTLTAVLITQRLGSSIFTGLSVTASLVVSVLLDQYGLLGLKQHGASPMRLAGCGLLVAGVWLVTRS